MPVIKMVRCVGRKTNDPSADENCNSNKPAVQGNNDTENNRLVTYRLLSVELGKARFCCFTVVSARRCPGI